ncbi:MAG: RNA-directed DNA polymerase [Burkholderiaceae bacterium]|jgi:retron-type reverse transcriptase|nr:RNA-directed DNA polymerase [Burkholderiaceae bacterium]
MSNAPNPDVPDSALTREQLYERLRNSSKQEVVLEEMQRLGFWPADTGQPTVEEQLIRRERELSDTLTRLGQELRGIENREQALKAMRKERMAQARERREQTRQRLAHQRHERALAWYARRQRELLYLGEGVSAGLNETAGDDAALARHALPPLHTASELAAAMGLSLAELRFLAWQREVARVSHYQRFTLPKKSGGTRQISAPMPRLKRAQYWVLDNVLAKVPLHEAAHGFRAGRSILSNAAPHVGQAVVINLDLKDFFPSIGLRRVRGVFRQLGYGEQVATLLALLCTEAPTDEVQIDGARYFVARGERVLPQGAPTSPALTNVLCRRLDARLAGCAAKLGFRYTRYADDLSFSAAGGHHRDSARLLWRVHQIIASEGFTPHPDKQQVMRPHRRQHVTGLVVNRKLSIDRATLRRFRAVLHQAERRGVQGLHWQGSANLLDALAGYAHFVAMVDSARGQPLVQRVRALQAREAGSSVAAAPAQASRLPSGSFRARAAAGQAPWPDWWQPAEAPAPVLEKTAEQIATDKRAEREVRREAARPQTAVDHQPPTPAAGGMASPPLWKLGLVAQILCTLLLAPYILTMSFIVLGVTIYSATRREAGWKRYVIAVAASWLLNALIRR